MLTTTEAAKVIGCSAPHVRLLIRRKKIRAKKRNLEGPNGGKMFQYQIEREEALRYRNKCFARGRPRGH